VIKMQALRPCAWTSLPTATFYPRRHKLSVFGNLEKARPSLVRYISLAGTARQASPANKMEVELTAPNGRMWSQPLGLFIGNEFVKSTGEQKLASINPA